MFMTILTCHSAKAQLVVVSEYFNASDTRDEWTELLVINDNTDLRNYTLRDNNTDQDNWQPEITFSNISFWNNLRSGTIIVLWHRRRSSVDTTDRLVDTNKLDGFIEVHAQLSGYFSGGSFATAPTWNGVTLAIGGSGEIIQLRDSLGNNVHALGHKSAPGSSYSGILGTNKLNHALGISSNNNIYVCPGGNIGSYIGGFSGNTFTSRGTVSSRFTQGLPNNCLSSSTANETYWLSLRQPIYANPTQNIPTANIGFTAVNLGWSACTDFNSSDLTTGYLILRNTANSFTNPQDGEFYNNGDFIGSATVVANINSSITLSFTDNYAFSCGTIYYYKIYAFRYGEDDFNGNSFYSTRGRAYNEIGTNVQSIAKINPTNTSSIEAY